MPPELTRRANLIGRILPAGTVGYDLAGSFERVMLEPRDAVHVRTAVRGRQAEFAAGRLCARRALRVLGEGSAALRPTSARSPAWPEGVVGTITHCSGYCAAAVGNYSFRSIGIDAERVAGISHALWRHIFSKREIARIVAAPEPDAAATLVFSAKEAFFKLQHPVLGRWPEFLDVDVAFDDYSFSLDLREASLAALLPAPLEGRYIRRGEVIVTAMIWPLDREDHWSRLRTPVRAKSHEP